MARSSISLPGEIGALTRKRQIPHRSRNDKLRSAHAPSVPDNAPAAARATGEIALRSTAEDANLGVLVAQPDGVRDVEGTRYSNRALILIFAFRTFETGHPFSAASAYFWKVAASAPGTFPTTSM